MFLHASTVTSEQASGRRPGTLSFLLFLLLITSLRVNGSTVTLPIEVEYPLLRQLLIGQLFNTPDKSREILHDPSGCSQILLSNPRLSAKRPNLEMVTEVKVQLGVTVLGGCTTLVQWDGSAGFLGRPVVQPEANSLRIEPIDSWLVAADGRRITSGRIWDLAKRGLAPQLSRFTLDLTPSVNALSTMLPEVLPHRSKQQLEIIIGSLRLADIQVTPASLTVSLSFQVEEFADQSQPQVELSAQELRQWEERWQMMDALFTYAVKFYASATTLQELRDTLLDILLDSRYRLRDALTTPATRANDPVRRWFVESWRRLRPVIRKIGLEQSGQEPLLWISLVTATDALYALDRLGPSIGLDISADGLRRLARLIKAQAGSDPLNYDEAVDPDLQELFQLLPPPEPGNSSGFRFELWPVRSAWAGSTADRLNRWAPSTDQLGEYLPLVAGLLKKTADQTRRKRKLEPQVDKLFTTLVLATAWQESCWRQYTVKQKKMQPLRSGSGDVGIMQINEKVWRGFYDIQKLRWDISYNSRAGAEVLLNYLLRYALKQGENKRSGGLDNLARASYSAYNGGPGQVSRYRDRSAASTLKKIDAAFWKKYQQVKAGNELDVAQCLGGETKDLSKKLPAAKAVKKSVTDKKTKTAISAPSQDAETHWVLAQQASHFTLQLAVFSTKEPARKFIAKQSLGGLLVIYPMRKGRTTQYAVLYGSYEKRADADRAKKRLKHLKPWVRQFGDVRKATP